MGEKRRLQPRHGIQLGLGMRSRAASDAQRQFAWRHVYERLARDLAAARSMQATTRVLEFAPVQSTRPHYHTHGHEVLCALRGELTTEYGDGSVRITSHGQARYVPDRLVHRGVNRGAETVRVMSINVARHDVPFRVEQQGVAR